MHGIYKTPNSSKIEIAHSSVGEGEREGRGGPSVSCQNCPCVCLCVCLCVVLCNEGRVLSCCHLPSARSVSFVKPKQVNAASGRPWHCRATFLESSRQTPPPGLLSAPGFWGRGDPDQWQSFSCRAWWRLWSSCCTSSRLSSTRWLSSRTMTGETEIWMTEWGSATNSWPTAGGNGTRNSPLICSDLCKYIMRIIISTH